MKKDIGVEVPVVVVQRLESEWKPGSRTRHHRLMLPPFPSLDTVGSDIKIIVQKLYFSDITGFQVLEQIQQYSDLTSCYLPGVALILAGEELKLILDPEIPWEDKSISINIRVGRAEELSFYSQRDGYKGRRKDSKTSRRKIISNSQGELLGEEIKLRDAIDVTKQVSLKIGYYTRSNSINYFDDIELYYDYAYLSTSQFWSLFTPHPSMPK